MPNTTPYMTQKHFEVLADELAQDKFFYDSLKMPTFVNIFTLIMD